MARIESERLVIRDWEEGDAPALYAICLDPELRRSGIHFFGSVEECAETIRFWKKKDEMRAIARKGDGSLVGLIGLCDMNRYDGYRELEFAVAAKHRGKGYATEALARMLAYGYDDLNLLVIAAWVRSFNAKSARVLEKCSFTHEGTLRRHARDQGDTLCYSILREEWERFRRNPA